MKAIDHSTPWGRSADDVVSRKRDMHTQRLHKQRLHSVKSTIDTSQPMTANMRHLTNKEKSKKLALDRQQEIDLENNKLVEKMAHILRGRSRKLCAAPPFQHMESTVAPSRRRELGRIATENRAIAARIRAQVPNYDHQEMAEHYKKSSTYGKNISRTQRREQRARSHMLLEHDPADPYTALKNLGITSSLERTNRSAPSKPTISLQDSIGASTMNNTTSLTKLTTANEIRRQTALERGYDLDSRVISSMSVSRKKTNRMKKMSPVKHGQFRFQMDHTGREFHRPSLPSMGSTLDYSNQGTLSAPLDKLVGDPATEPAIQNESISEATSPDQESS